MRQTFKMLSLNIRIFLNKFKCPGRCVEIIYLNAESRGRRWQKAMSFLNGCCGQEAPGQMFSGEAAARHSRSTAGRSGAAFPPLSTSSSGEVTHETFLLISVKRRSEFSLLWELKNHLWSAWDETLDRCLLLLRAHRTHTPQQHVYIVKENKDGPGVTYDMTEDVILIRLWSRQGDFGVPYSIINCSAYVKQ